MARPPASQLRTVVFAAVGVAAAAELSYRLALGGIVSIWFPSGLILAALLLTDRTRWVLLLLGAYAGNVVIDLSRGIPPGLSVLAPVANMVEASAAAWVVQRVVGRQNPVTSIRGAGALLVGAALVSNAVTAVGGGGTLAWAYQSSFARAWVSWWIGDGLGIMVTAPAVLGFLHWKSDLPRGKGRTYAIVEVLAFLAVAAALVSLTFSRPGTLNPPVSALLFSLIILAGLRLKAGAHAVVLFASILVVWFSGRGHGPLVAPGLTPLQVATHVYAFLGIVAASAVVLAAAVVERGAAEEQRERFRTQLIETTRASEERYRELFESSPQILWVYDLETLAFLAVNDAAVAKYGYPRDEFLSMTIADIRPAADVPALLDNVSQVHDGLDEAGIWRHILRDGTPIDVEIRSHALSYAARPAELVMATDVTARLLQEREIRALTATLESRVAERTRELQIANEELESFSYSVSHDLKAPVRAIDGYAAILGEELESHRSGDVHRLLGEVRANAKRMGRLIEDLLAFSRVRRAGLNGQRVELEPLVVEILDRQRALAPNRRITLDLGPLPAVQGDLALLRQALENILGNAVKFTGPRQEAVIRVNGTRQGDLVEIHITDNGVGFPSEMADNVFGVFERLHTEDEFEGTGVGLAIVKRVVERHGGEVVVSSQPDRGTTVRVVLPASADPPTPGHG